ncbi:MAG: hypothetical protein C5617_000485, partial [ANME-2 cluster archaeon]
MNYRPPLFVFAIILALLLPSVAYAAGSADDIDITVTIPDRKEGVFASDKLVASGSEEGARITFENRGTETATISATIKVPDLLPLSVPTQELGGQIAQDGNTLTVSDVVI